MLGAVSVDWGVSSLTPPHTVINTSIFNQTVVTYNLQEARRIAMHAHTQTRRLSHLHTCSWYSMPIDIVLIRMAIMIPLLKYLLPTMRSSLVRSPAQQHSHSLFFGSDTCASPLKGLLQSHGLLLWHGLLPWHELLYPWRWSSVCSLTISVSLSWL